MAKRGGRRRRRRDQSAPAGNKEGRFTQHQSLEVTLEHGSSHSTAPFSVPPPLPASGVLDFTNDAALQSLQDCWSQVSQRKRQSNLTPTPIQCQSWSVLIPGLCVRHDNSTHDRPPFSRSLVVLGPTGCGKTLAYGVPLLLNVSSMETQQAGLILVPTRELASQVQRELRSALTPVLTRQGHVRLLSIHGGVDRQEQRQALLEQTKRNLILVATPGRLVDLLSDENCRSESLSTFASRVKFVVLDEADRLAINTDLAQQVDDILDYLPPVAERSMCLFSATCPERIKTQWEKWSPFPQVCIKVNTFTVGSNEKPATERDMDETDPSNLERATKKQKHTIGPIDVAQIPAHIEQILHVCAAHKKPRKLLTTLCKIRAGEASQRQKSLCLVFFGKIKTLQYVQQLLLKQGVRCAEFHSHMPQPAREKALHNFRSGKIPILLSTDIAARGIHCNHIERVINYDFPGTLEQYVHRCGRAGRNRSLGSGDSFNKPSTAVVYSFFTRNLSPLVPDVIALLRSCNAWVDPNLESLLSESGSSNAEDESVAEPTTLTRRPEEATTTRKAGMEEYVNEGPMRRSDDDSQDDSQDDPQFRYLNPQRITLARASHVGDASDLSEDDESIPV